MKGLKKLLRQMLSGRFLRMVEQTYRFGRGLIAQIIFGWPTRGMTFVMITGTNGKTTTAHFLFQILRFNGENVGMSTTTDFQINDTKVINDTNMTVVDPFKLRKQLKQMRKAGVKYAIIEATSQALDQNRLFGIPCQVAIMTNLTQDHLDYHGTMENYAAAKARLFRKKIKSAVLNSDDEWFDYFKAACGSKKIITYGRHGDFKLTNYRGLKEQGSFDFIVGGETISAKLPLTGEYNAYNALAAIAAASELGQNAAKAAASLPTTPQVDGRLEQVRAGQKFQVVVDYAHTPDGLEKVLTAAREMVPSKGRVWLVFGSCGDRDGVKRPIMGKIASGLADQIVVTDEEPYSEDPAQIRREVWQGITIKKKAIEIADRLEAMRYAFERAASDDIVLITGLGHEQYRVFNGYKQKWNDIEESKKLLKR